MAGIIAGAGCSRHETAVDRGDRLQILHIGNKDEPADLDPHINNADSTGTILTSLFAGLVSLAGDGRTILPGIADQWAVSEDGLTYNFHIRKDARWSNGQPITSKDFLDGFLRVLDPKLGCETAGYAFPIHGARDFVEGRSADPATVGLRAPGPDTFIVSLDYPAPWFLSVLTNYPFYPVYMPSLDAAGGRHQRGGAWERPGILVSDGPFTLAEWKPNAYVRVVRNPNYWDASHVRLSEIWFHPTDDENTEEREFRSGQLHITARLPKSKVDVYASEHPKELHVVPSLRTSFLTFNVHRAPFDDSRVRRAFALAIDRERMVRAALGRLGTPAYSLTRPGAGGYTMPNVFHYDPVEARSLLAGAGHAGGTGLGAVEFTLNGTTGVTLDLAAVLQQMWAENLGIHVSVLPVEFKVYLSTLREKQFQVLLDGWVSIDDPRDMAELNLAGDPNNDSGVDDAVANEAFAAADHAPNRQARQRAFEALEARNESQAYYVPLYYFNHGFLVDRHVQGWTDNSLGRIAWRDLYLAP
ncbi:MAG TPA: peptide ABC transporter substrate-binding protein [Opitutaceae bacterium]